MLFGLEPGVTRPRLNDSSERLVQRRAGDHVGTFSLVSAEGIGLVVIIEVVGSEEKH